MRALSPRPFRKITHRRVTPGFTLTEAIYAPNAKVGSHSHRLACFGLVLEGNYVESYGQIALECKSSNLKFRPAGEAHSDSYSNRAVRCFFVEFEAEWLERMREHGVSLNEPAVFQSNSLLCLAMKIRREARHSDALSQLVVEGLMLEVIAEASRNVFAPTEPLCPRWLKQARDILHARFSERLTLQDIGAAVGVHPVYLASAFRRGYRCSVGEYLRTLRIDFACRELSMTDVPLAQVALAAGFPHQSQFSRTFKRVTGLTPAQYRSTTSS